MSEKPSFIRLKKLINKEWHTSATVKAKEGIARFRGFCGDYDICVYAGDRRIPASVTVSKNGNNTATVLI